MRFGSTLHTRRVPAWAESYVDYTRLKVLVDDEPPLEELKEAIHSEIDIVNGFLASQDRFIEAQILALDEHWGVKIGSANPPDFHGVAIVELEDLKTSLLEIADNIIECQRYIRVNHDSVSRILAKAAVKYTADEVSDIDVLPKLTRHGKSSAHGPWLPQLNATLQHLGEALKETDPSHSARSLLLEHAGSDHFPAETLGYLREDDAPALEGALNDKYPDPSDARESALARLVQIATIHGSSGCQRKLLSSLRSKSAEEPIPKHHDYLHKIIQQLGRAEPPLDSAAAATAFHKVLKLLHPSQIHLIQSQDILGRLPLHHAALHGLDGVCREIISVVRDPTWKGSLDKLRISPDVFRLTPMDYAIRKGHAAVVEALSGEYETLARADRSQQVEKLDILATAIASEATEISRQLIKKGWGTQFVGRSGQTVLHIAAVQGLSELIEDIASAAVSLDAQESVRGWTALAAASVLGNTQVVEALIRSGADTLVRDHRNWLAKDHAAYRGHMKVVGAIETEGSWELQSKPGRHLGAANVIPKRSSSDSVVFVHLGTLDLYKEVNAVDLTPYKKRIYPVQIPDTSLGLSMSLVGGGSQKEHNVSLPFMSDNSDCPWCFTTDDPDNVTIVFKITSLLEETPIGTGVALVSSLTTSLGEKRDTLIRDYSIPLVSDKYGHVGTILFTVIVARPYGGANPPPKDAQRLALEPSSTLGGHRGNGQNDNSGCLQVGENTIESFRTAMELGADIVELDVQLTKDDIPVVYHDFLVAEKGSDAPMHTLTYKQFKAISDAQTPTKWQETSGKRFPWDERERPQVAPKERRNSLCMPLDSTTDALVGQMKHTLNYPGYKPNLRNHSIHEPFITLEELYRGLPEDIPLDIELKYPMLYEAADFQMDNYASEINLFLDKILSVTYAHAGRRRIIFTTFSPEICMVLAVKQQSYPMLFLNDSSNWPTGDMRATSLQTASRLAHRFGLNGVAMASEPFIYSPGTVGLVRRQGLYTATYGPLNDNGPSVEIQGKAGVDLVIVNRVKGMRLALDRARAKVPGK